MARGGRARRSRCGGHGMSIPASSKIASAKSAHVQSPSAATCQSPRGRSASTSSRVGFCEMSHVRRAPALVVDDRDLVALHAESEHRPDEVVARRAEEPRRAEDPCSRPGRGLAVQLRPAVRGRRVRPVRLDVRRTLPPVEDVVGRVRDERRLQRRRVRRASDVHRRRALRDPPRRRRRSSTRRCAGRGRRRLVTQRRLAAVRRPSPRA